MKGIVKDCTMEETAEIVRNAMGHRAVWMALIYDEMKKAGVPDADKIIRRAIRRCGLMHGDNFKKICGSGDCRDFLPVFNNELDVKVFESVQSSESDSMSLEFHHCPLVSAWKNLGLNDELISELCDMAMEGDRGIAEANEMTLDLQTTIADGFPSCKMEYRKK